MSTDFDKLSYTDYFIKLYLKDIGPLKTLTSEEEQQLIIEYKQGNNDAVEELILKSQYIVLEEVLYFSNRGIELLDLLQNANVALIYALRRYSQEKGSMKNYLHRNVYRYLENQTIGFHSVIRYPANVLREIKDYVANLNKNDDKLYNPKYLNNSKIFESLLGDENITAVSEISDRVDIPIDSIFENKSSYVRFDIFYNSLKKELEHIFSNLSERETKIIKLYFGIGKKNSMTLGEIGTSYRLTRERIRQIKEKTIRRLRHSSRSKLLRQYLDIFESDPDYYAEYKGRMNPFVFKMDNEDNAISILTKYVEPRRRKTSYPEISNIAEVCRKLIKDFLEKQGIACSYNELKSYVFEQLPMLNQGSFVYALSTLDGVVSTHKGIYALKEWLHTGENISDEMSSTQQIADSHPSNNKLGIDSTIFTKIDFSFKQLSLIEFFLENMGKLSKLKITIFSRSHNIDYNQTINDINRKFMDEYDMSFIKEENTNYIIDTTFIE